MDIQVDFEINRPVGYLITAKRNYFHRRTLPLKKSCSVQMTVFELRNCCSSQCCQLDTIIDMMYVVDQLKQCAQIYLQKAAGVGCVQ